MAFCVCQSLAAEGRGVLSSTVPAAQKERCPHLTLNPWCCFFSFLFAPTVTLKTLVRLFPTSRLLSGTNPKTATATVQTQHPPRPALLVCVSPLLILSATPSSPLLRLPSIFFYFLSFEISGMGTMRHACGAKVSGKRAERKDGERVVGGGAPNERKGGGRKDK